MERHEILRWLKETDSSRLDELWAQADGVRKSHVGDEVYFRGLIEISNHCMRQCGYCGIRAGHTGIERYRMSAEEVLECARLAVQLGYGTVVLQSGEDPGVSARWIADLVGRVKAETSLAITLSLGERNQDELAMWKEAGADRYLLRFETSNAALFSAIHPSHPGKAVSRMRMLRELALLGYEVGSGIMVGIPGQTWDDLVNDITAFRDLDLDMVGVGPYIPHPDTPLGQNPPPDAATGQVPNDEMTTYKVVALTRLVRPDANIPSTTALATLNLAEGRELGLMRGANIVMPNLTPVRYRALYEIYPAKACIRETANDCAGCLRRRVESIGRTVGKGPGVSPNWDSRRRRMDILNP